MTSQTSLIAHRGASALAPENTLSALQLAHEMGARWVEIDVQVTHDGGLVLMHDHTVDRTTNGSGPVTMMRLEDVTNLRTLDPSAGQATEHAPPRLDDVVSLCERLSLGLVLEIKATWGIAEDDGAAIAEALPRNIEFPLLITSFSLLALAAFGDIRPDIDLGMACLRPPRDPAAAAKRWHLSAIHCNAGYVTAEDFVKIREAGLQSAVATVNNADAARNFLQMGADAVMTDHPDLLK